MANLPKTTAAAISTTLTALLAPLAIPQADIEAGVQVLIDRVCGKGVKSITDQRPIDRVLSAKETAELLHRSTKTVQELAKRGALRRVYCGAGAKRASGYSEQSVRAFLAGKEAA